MNPFEKIIASVPEVRQYAEFDPIGEYAGIQAITYSLPHIFHKEYEAFAYIGFPAEQKDEKIPAVVLVHGGLGHAYVEWVKKWNDRGYAAIAMDTEGFYPEGRNAGIAEKPAFRHGAYGAFLRDNLADSPKNDAMASASEPLEKQWMFHAVAKVILARNLLRTYGNIDKIGICGISWGSIITSLTIGYDPQYDFVISIYGSGYLLQNMGFCGDNFRENHVGDIWLAEKRSDQIRMPYLLLCADDDKAFSPDANSLFYDAIKGQNSFTRLSIVHDFVHGHRTGWAQMESYVFADAVCKSHKPLIRFQMSPKGHAFTVKTDETPLFADVYYICAPLCYLPCDEDGKKSGAEEWKRIPCMIDGHIVSANLPREAHTYFLVLGAERDGEAYTVSSELIHIS